MRNIGRVVQGDLSNITTAKSEQAAETKLGLGTSWAGPLNKAAQVASAVYNGVAALTKTSKESAGAAAGQAAAHAAPRSGRSEGRRL